jgi:hypothetical protein
MIKLRGGLFALFLFVAMVLPVTAASFSSSSSSIGSQIHFHPEQIIKFAKKVEKEMASRGARVAILARMGRPPSELPEGMHFTHVAFAVYSEITTTKGDKTQGYAIHNLYQEDGSPDVSNLVVDFPVDFFNGVSVLEAGVLIPSDELQLRLLSVIGSPSYKKLHESSYSVIANPFNTGRQNCTEFVLDIVNSAMYQTDDIDRIKLIERSQFKAQRVNVSPLKLMLGGMFSKEVSLKDHDGDPQTATFETISAYLGQFDKGAEYFTVLPDR